MKSNGHEKAPHPEVSALGYSSPRHSLRLLRSLAAILHSPFPPPLKGRCWRILWELSELNGMNGGCFWNLGIDPAAKTS